MLLQTEDVKNFTDYYYKWLAETDYPSEFRMLLLSLELVLDFVSIPVNLVIAWCLMKTQTFHFNVRLLMLNDILSGITEIAFRAIIIANILKNDTLIPLNVKKGLQFSRAFCICQVQFGFLSILTERLVAVSFPHRYEKTPIYVGVAMVVIWALFLTQHWISSQRAFSKPSATLSTRYQVVENIKTLSMFRYWVYFYVFMGLIQKIVLFFCYSAFKVGDKEWWRLCSNYYELAHAAYILLYPAFLLYGSYQLRKRVYVLFKVCNGAAISAESHIALKTEGMDHLDAFNSHFKRLEASWERPLK